MDQDQEITIGLVSEDFVEVTKEPDLTNDNIDDSANVLKETDEDDEEIGPTSSLVRYS
jgi:hypothetical protein